MNKNLVRGASILVLLSGVYAYFRLQVPVPATDSALHYAPTLAITPGYDIRQTLVPQEDGMSGISLMFTVSTNRLARSSGVRFSLTSGERLVFERDFSQDALPLDTPMRLSFEREPHSAGCAYELRVLGLGQDGPGERVHLMLVPESERADWARVTVNGNAWPYVAWIVCDASDSAILAGTLTGGLGVILLLLWLLETLCGGRGALVKTGKMQDSGSFDWSMHYFRAFAILCIAVEHYLCVAGYLRWSSAWFQTGTVYFLFISGYLCRYLHEKRPDAPLAYYRKKLSNVIAPYLLWTIWTVLVVWLFGFSRPGVITKADISWGSLLGIFGCGRAQVQYWYIPFVSILFLMSPRLVRMESHRFIGLCFASFVLMIVSEGFRGYKSFQHVCSMYALFTCPYVFGMAFSRYREVLGPFFRRYAALALILGCFIGLTILYPGVIIARYDKVLLQTALQKCLFTIVAVVALERAAHCRIWLFDQIARLSFTIYFCHVFFIEDFVHLKNCLVTACAVPELPAFGFAGLLYLSFLVFFSWLLKQAFGRHSRWFIGA